MYTCIIKAIKAIANLAATTIAIIHEFCHALLTSPDDKCLAKKTFVKLLKCEKHCIHDGWPMSHHNYYENPIAIVVQKCNPLYVPE